MDDRAKNVEADLRNAMNSKNQRLEVELTGIKIVIFDHDFKKKLKKKQNLFVKLFL